MTCIGKNSSIVIYYQMRVKGWVHRLVIDVEEYKELRKQNNNCANSFLLICVRFMRPFFAKIAFKKLTNLFLQSTGSDAYPTDYLMFFSPCKAESPDMVSWV